MVGSFEMFVNKNSEWKQCVGTLKNYNCEENKVYYLLSTSSGACVLSTHSDSPPVTKTTMSPNLLHALNVITQLGINVLGKNLTVFSSLEILLTIEKPKRNLELTWILDNRDKFFNFIGSEFTSALVHIDFCLFANQVCEPASKTLDLGQTKDNISFSLYVGIEDTENVLKLGSLH